MIELEVSSDTGEQLGTVTLDIGSIESGAWCDRCLKPSGVRVHLYMLGDDGVAPSDTVVVCDECGDDE